MKETLNNEHLEPLIVAIRGHRVVLDADLARLYGVDTKRFNEAFKRNRDRFPADFAFQLTAEEFAELRSQIATSSSHPLIPWRTTGRNLRPVPMVVVAIFLGRLPSTAP